MKKLLLLIAMCAPARERGGTLDRAPDVRPLLALHRVPMSRLLGDEGFWSPPYFFAGPCPAGYGWQQAYTVASSQITGTLVNFPVTVPLQNNNWKLSAGYVTNANNYDSIWVNAAGTALPFELVGHGTSSTTWDGTAGNAEFWINVDSIAVGTVIYNCMGKGSISTYQGNDSGTWDSNFVGVWHAQNGTTLASPVPDSTSHALAGAWHNSPTVQTGKVGGAFGTTVAGANWLTAPSYALTSGAFTFSLWAAHTAAVDDGGVWNMSLTSTSGASFGITTAGNANDWLNGDMLCFGNGYNSGRTPRAAAAHPVYADYAWHYYTCRLDASNASIWYDGAAVTMRVSTPGSVPSNTHVFTLADNAGANEYLDEIRFSNNIRSDAWVAAEYHNSVAPATFWTIGSLQPTTAAAAIRHRVIGGE